MNNTELKKLIPLCLKNDAKAQSKLFKSSFNLFMSIAFKYTKDRDTANEMVQRGMIKVFDKLKDYKSEGSFSSWMGRVVSNVCIDYHREKKHEVVDNGNENYDVEDEEYVDDLYELKLQLIKDVVEKLSPSYKRIFTMFYFEKMMHKDIAKKLGLSESTTKTNLMKAKAKVSRIVKEQFNQIINE